MKFVPKLFGRAGGSQNRDWQLHLQFTLAPLDAQTENYRNYSKVKFSKKT
jgi:hypothetical protein